MKKIVSMAFVAGLTSLSFVIVSPAQAQPSAESAYDFRTSLMNVYKWYMGPMAAMAKGKTEYDANIFAANATSLADAAKLDVLAGFVKDSSELDLEDSEAKPDLWDQWDKFESKFKDFKTEFQALAEVAKSGDKAKSMEQFKIAAQTCSGCHKPFRTKK